MKVMSIHLFQTSPGAVHQGSDSRKSPFGHFPRGCRSKRGTEEERKDAKEPAPFCRNYYRGFVIEGNYGNELFCPVPNGPWDRKERENQVLHLSLQRNPQIRVPGKHGVQIPHHWISMRPVSLSGTASFFGMTTVRTPFSNFAWMSSGVTSCPTRKDLRQEAVLRSLRTVLPALSF